MFLLTVTFLCISAVLAQNDADCGSKGPANVDAKIVGGTNANELEFPWQISLRTTTGSGWYHTCGGSIIKNQWILTAAHCVDRTSDASKYIVRVGEHNRGVVSGKEIDKAVSKVIKHGQYNSQTIDYDVALLKLSTPLDFNANSYLGTVCIPDQGDAVAAGTNCVSTGWGNTAWQGSSPNILQKVTIPIVDQARCQSAYSGVNAVTARMICSGTGGKGTCQGDSGGPLQCRVNGKWVLHGATSWAVRCAESAYPSVAARVAQFSTWIWQQISAN